MFLFCLHFVTFVCSQRVKNAHSEVTEARQLDQQIAQQADEILANLIAANQLTAVWKSGKLIFAWLYHVVINTNFILSVVNNELGVTTADQLASLTPALIQESLPPTRFSAITR